MKDKRLEEMLRKDVGSELQFTEEDRQSVFKKIRQMEEEPVAKKQPVMPLKRMMPVAVSIMAIGICLFLFLPSLLTGNPALEQGSGDGSDSGAGVVPKSEGAEIVTTLVSVKTEQGDERAYVHLLFSYHSKTKKMKVVSIPYDAYVTLEKDGEVMQEDKLLFTYQHGGAEQVKQSVSSLFDVPIDNYAIVDLDDLNELVALMDGVEYELLEDNMVRAITQMAFDFKKGTHRFNGEEVAALLMAATGGVHLVEEEVVTIIDLVMEKMKSELSSPELKEWLAKVETNGSVDDFLANLRELDEMELIPLQDGLIDDAIIFNETEGYHIYRFKEGFLGGVTKELTSFELHRDAQNTLDIKNDEQVEQIKAILNSIEWETAKVNMQTPPDYQFNLISDTEVTLYNLWISPKRDKIELIIPSENKYMQLDQNTSAKLFEILTGNQLSETKTNE